VTPYNEGPMADMNILPNLFYALSVPEHNVFLHVGLTEGDLARITRGGPTKEEHLEKVR
jgi:hypothetical protein